MQTIKRFTLDNITNGGKVMSGPILIGTFNGVRFEVWEVTPQTAATWLQRVHNRPKKAHRIKKYARIMSDGRWKLNFEWIGIDTEGYVIEGQHRLEACVLSDTSFVTLVLFGLPREVFPYIGSALPRGVADNLALVGEVNCNILGGAVAYVWRADHGLPMYMTGIGARPDNDEAIATLAAHPNLTDSVNAARRCVRVFPSIAMLAYLHYEFGKRDPVLAESFIDKLATGVGLRASDPVHVLRERLRDNLSSKAKLPNKYILAITIKAWNYARAGRSAPKFIRWSDGANEAFPMIQ